MKFGQQVDYGPEKCRLNFERDPELSLHIVNIILLLTPQCFDAVGWAGRRASGLQKLSGTGVVICLQRGANDLHMIQLMPLPPVTGNHWALHRTGPLCTSAAVLVQRSISITCVTCTHAPAVRL